MLLHYLRYIVLSLRAKRQYASYYRRTRDNMVINEVNYRSVTARPSLFTAEQMKDLNKKLCLTGQGLHLCEDQAASKKPASCQQRDLGPVPGHGSARLQTVRAGPCPGQGAETAGVTGGVLQRA